MFSSDSGVPTPLGGTPPRNPNLTGLCEIVAAPPGLGFNYLVRFFGSPGNLAVTIRTKGVEQVICPTQRHGRRDPDLPREPWAPGPSQTKSVDFTAPAGLEARRLRLLGSDDCTGSTAAAERTAAAGAPGGRSRLSATMSRPLRGPPAEGFLTFLTRIAPM